ncbi:hypothetical protein F5Y16DRAFT_381145 [Xylariaceae sp. FL0255]|nr:hypothetical protein F5Y16DRAFT_381145 [Xylariaceae sp. FL0255]
MRRLRIQPLPLLVLVSSAALCSARLPGFSVHHDPLAYPQFEVVYSESFIAESEAHALLDRADPDDDRHLEHGESYEIMTLPPHRYLCSIPVIEPPPAPNKTATELAKAEEARELQRAAAHGTDLINALDGTCLYYMSGWWSYRFCYGQDVVQFHAVPNSLKGGPPTRDPSTAEYVLGRVPDPNLASHRQTQNQRPPDHPAQTTELQVKGDQRFLVQKMADGTICDLTGRERTIEVQYHCSPGATQDRIGWIKEVTTCSYLMMINTPRLCTDVAFQPPKEEKANIVACRVILSEPEEATWHILKSLEAQAAMVAQSKEAASAPVTIGGIEVGGRQLIGKGEDGKAAPQLSPPRGFRPGGELGQLVEIIASAAAKDEGGEVSMMSEQQLEALDLSPEIIEDLKQQIEKLAGDKGWKLELVEVPGNAGRELLGVIEDDDGEVEEGEGEGGGENTSDDEKKGSEERFFKEEL